MINTINIKMLMDPIDNKALIRYLNEEKEFNSQTEFDEEYMDYIDSNMFDTIDSHIH